MNLIFENNDYNMILNDINNNLKNDNKCMICRDALNNDIINLGCNHKYHSNCLTNSFIKYEQKRCLFCNSSFNLNLFKSQCSKMMASKQCTKFCYNQEKLCNIHLKQKMNEIVKNKKNININIKKKNDKINKLNTMIKQLHEEVKQLEKSLKKIDF